MRSFFLSVLLLTCLAAAPALAWDNKEDEPSISKQYEYLGAGRDRDNPFRDEPNKYYKDDERPPREDRVRNERRRRDRDPLDSRSRPPRSFGEIQRRGLDEID